MRAFTRVTVAVMLALIAAQSSAAGQAAAKPRQDRYRIDADEIRSRPVTTVHQLIKSRRSHWLSTRGQATLQTRQATDVYEGGSMTLAAEPQIVVYIDDVRNGSQELLRSISTDEVDSLEYLDAQAATQRFGTGHAHGAILIRRRVR